MSNSIKETSVLRILFSHICFYTARNLFTLFMSFLIWSHTKDLQLLTWYLISYIVGHMAGFTGFAPLVKKISPHPSRVGSLVGQVIFFFLLFLYRDQAILQIIPIALIGGFLNGMYWISYNTLRFDLTTTQNRGNYSGASKALTTAAGIIAPMVGGALVSFNAFGIGYGNVFILLAILNLLAIIIGNVSPPKHISSSLHIVESAKKIFKQPDITKLMIGKCLGNLGYRTILEKILPIFILDVIGSEFQVSGWISVFSGIAVITSYLIGKYIPYSWYKKSMMIGGALFSLSTLALVGMPMLVTYILFGVVREIIFPLMNIPQSVYTENVLHTIPDYQHHRVEYIVIREWIYVFVSRMIGYSFLFFVPTLTGTEMRISLLLVGIAIMLEPLILRTIKQDMTKI